MPQFLLLLRGFLEEAVDEMGPEDYQNLVERYDAWVEDLKAQKRLLGAEHLAAEGGWRLSRADREIVVDGPFAETKETVAGFFLIEAADYREAIAVGRRCPVLEHGGTVEVRRLFADSCRYSTRH